MADPILPASLRRLRELVAAVSHEEQCARNASELIASWKKGKRAIRKARRRLMGDNWNSPVMDELMEAKRQVKKAERKSARVLAAWNNAENEVSDARLRLTRYSSVAVKTKNDLETLGMLKSTEPTWRFTVRLLNHHFTRRGPLNSMQEIADTYNLRFIPPLE